MWFNRVLAFHMSIFRNSDKSLYGKILMLVCLGVVMVQLYDISVFVTISKTLCHSISTNSNI